MTRQVRMGSRGGKRDKDCRSHPLPLVQVSGLRAHLEQKGRGVGARDLHSSTEESLREWMGFDWEGGCLSKERVHAFSWSEE